MQPSMLLMFHPKNVYLAIYPWLLDYFNLSDPARSTNVILPYFFTLLLSLVYV